MKRLIYILIIIAAFISCKQDYFEDSGVHNPKFNGTIMQYLESKGKNPIDPFDTLVQIIKVAGMQNTFENENITFFAPPDPSIGKALKQLNVMLYIQGQDTVSKFDQVKPAVWKYFLSQYIIKGDYGLIDFPQVDTSALYAFPGQIFQTLNQEESVNIGVVYHDLVNDETTIKYQGPRQILLSYVPDYSQASKGWINAFISSSNIQPSNGRVHVLNYNKHTFGFLGFRFSEKAIEYGVGK